MKKHLLKLLLPVMMISGLQVQAQDNAAKTNNKENEIYAGYGFLSTSTMIGLFSDMLATGLTGGNYRKENIRWSGNIHAGYKYRPSSGRLGIGFTYAHVNSSGDVFFNNTLAGRVKQSYNTFAAELDYRYVNSSFFKLYSAFGLGITAYKESYKPVSGNTEVNRKSHLNFQVSAIGIKLGNQIGVLGEFGFGYKGLFCIGLFAGF